MIRAGLAGVLVVAVTLASACTSPRPAEHARTHPSSAAVQTHYGLDPETGAGIRFQPDVVIVAGGASAVQSVTGDGLTWVISGRAANVDQLRPGKIMYVTAFGVGRVLAVTRDGADRAVTIGPVDLTDVVREGTFSANRPISLAGALTFRTPTRPGALTRAPGSPNRAPGAPSPAPGHSFLSLPRMTIGTLPPSVPALPGGFGSFPVPTRGAVRTTTVGSYAVTPVCCTSGIGLHYFYDADGMRVSATLTLHARAPRVDFTLRIAGGKIVTALATLSGAAGAEMRVDAATATGLAGNVTRDVVTAPIDFVVPINGLLSLTISQTFSLSTAFSARTGGISAHARYDFGGAVGFGYANGAFGVHRPAGWTVEDSLIDSVHGVSVGVAGIVLGYSVKLSVGIGFAGFSAGAWVALTLSYAMTNGASIGIIQCRGATLDAVLAYGLGFRIPAPVAAVVNFFLRVFRARPIQASGGVAGHESILHRHAYAPDREMCRSA